jgi:hypothetical protein
MWKDIVERGRPQAKIRRIRIACWKPKVTNTHSEYVIRITFPLQQWLYESASMWRHAYNTSIVIYIVEVISEKLKNCWKHSNRCSQRIRRGYSAYRGTVCSGASVVLKKSKLMNVVVTFAFDRGFKPGRSRRKFSGEKIHSMPSFGGEVKPSAPCGRIAACKKTPAIYVEVGIAGKIGRPFLAQFHPSLTEVSHFAWRGAPLDITGGTKGGAQRAAA